MYLHQFYGFPEYKDKILADYGAGIHGDIVEGNISFHSDSVLIDSANTNNSQLEFFRIEELYGPKFVNLLRFFKFPNYVQASLSAMIRFFLYTHSMKVTGIHTYRYNDGSDTREQCC